MKDIAIRIENISKKYCKNLKRSMLYGVHDILRNSLGLSSHSDKLRKGEFWALKDLFLDINRGETLGVIGPNGSGKTTLLKLLNGIFWPDKGKITIKGRVGALIAVGAGFHPLLTGRENIYINGAILGMSKKEIDKKFNDIVEFAEIGDFLDTPVKFYSSGMFVRLGFSIAAHCNPDILLVDEVLAVGDEGFQRKCFDKIGELKKSNATIVIVSHNMHLISTFVDRILFLNNGSGQIFDNVAEGIKQYTNLFISKKDYNIEKLTSGNDKITFYAVDIEKRTLKPHDSFNIRLKYDSKIDYDEVIIDTVIVSYNNSNIYFQATNKTFNHKINLLKGNHSLEISIDSIPLHNTIAKVVIAIYPKKRSGYLFWWRIPVEFKNYPLANGQNILKVHYKQK